MPARSIRPIMEGVDSTPSPPMCFTTRLSSTTMVISALSPGCNFSISTSSPPLCRKPCHTGGATSRAQYLPTPDIVLQHIVPESLRRGIQRSPLTDGGEALDKLYQRLFVRQLEGVQRDLLLPTAFRFLKSFLDDRRMQP